MGISYKPLFKLLVDRNMTKTDLRIELRLSSATLAKLSKGEALSGSVIEKLCKYFRCQVQDVVEITLDDEV
jgi:DNA-binding Xre family transcriptional regulator